MISGLEMVFIPNREKAWNRRKPSQNLENLHFCLVLILMVTALWLRKGLRLHDNPALVAAIQGSTHLVPIFCADVKLMAATPQTMSSGSSTVSPLWAPLVQLLADGLSSASGAASEHSHTAREDAARKLIDNHAYVLRDMSNPAPRTQHHLHRIDQSDVAHAEQALHEVARRLLGNTPAIKNDAKTAGQTSGEQLARDNNRRWSFWKAEPKLR